MYLVHLLEVAHVNTKDYRRNSNNRDLTCTEQRILESTGDLLQENTVDATSMHLVHLLEVTHVNTKDYRRNNNNRDLIA